MTSGPEPEDSTLAAILAERRRRRFVRMLLALALLLGAATFYWMRRPPTPVIIRPEAGLELPPPPLLPPPPPAPESIPPPPAPSGEPRPGPRAEALPELAHSDALVRRGASALSSRPQLETWLQANDLIRRFVVAIDNLAEGKTPRKHWSPLAPSAHFEVLREPTLPGNPEEERYLIDPSSWDRYNPLAEVFASLDVERAVALYTRLEPLFDQAYRELGYPDGRFRNALFEAIDELLRTPTGVGTDEVPLRRKVLGYAYRDPQLEGLSAAQKQLLRAGPGNVPRVQRKLRQLARALGARSSDLPTSPRYRTRRATGATR